MKEEQEVEESYRAGPVGANMDREDDPKTSPTKGIVIDLGAKRSGYRAGRLDESWLLMFGEATKLLMRAMFGNFEIPVKVKGTPSEIRSFATALSREKKHLQNISKYGLNNPRTYKSRGVLNKAVSKFERATGLKWPFK